MAGKITEVRLDLRAPQNEVDLWKRAASREGLSVNAFIRNATTLAAVRARPDIANEEG